MTLHTEAPIQTAVYHDAAQQLPPYPDGGGSRLLEVVDLTTAPAPEGAARYVNTKVHVVERPDGSIGHQVVNKTAPGASLLAIDVVQNHAYAVLVDQMRYPHVRPDDTSGSLEAAARAGRIGRWSREIMSGGADSGETLEAAALREAREEAGIVGVTPDRVHRLFPTLNSSVSINNQPFNLFYTLLRDGEFQPGRVHRDAEEGDMRVAAYRLDTAVPEMVGREIWEMSTVTALMGLWRVKGLRKYL